VTEQPPEARWRPEKGERGERGAAGATGARGARGPALSGPVRRAIAFLFILMFTFAGLNLAWSYHLATDQNTDKCSLIEHVIAIKAPGPTKGNPSRLAFAQLEAAFRVRGRQLGCPPGG